MPDIQSFYGPDEDDLTREDFAKVRRVEAALDRAIDGLEGVTEDQIVTALGRTAARKVAQQTGSEGYVAEWFYAWGRCAVGLEGYRELCRGLRMPGT